MHSTAENILKEVNSNWNKVFNTPFTKVLTKLPSTNLQEKPSDSSRKKKLRTIYRKTKQQIENSWKENNRDMKSLHGTRQSKSQYMKQRKSLYMEKNIAKRGNSSLVEYNIVK